MQSLSNNRAVIIVIVLASLGIGYMMFFGSNDAENSPTEPTATSTEAKATTSTAKSETTALTKKTTTTITTPKSATMTADGLYVISYTNAGFSPKTLTIKKGKGVRFVNNSDKAMRVFADDKNSQIYSALSQSKTVGRGGTYDFTFTQAG